MQAEVCPQCSLSGGGQNAGVTPHENYKYGSSLYRYIMTHVYAAYCLHVINIKETFLQVFYQVVTITQCPVMKGYTCAVRCLTLQHVTQKSLQSAL